MYKITVNGETLYANEGELLSDVLLSCGKSVDHPCGGKGFCRKCLVRVNGKDELSCQYKIRSDVSVVIPEIGEILSVTGANEECTASDNLCFILDIGTTTLALSLVSIDENKIIKVITRTNPQRVYGADIMTRIDYCRRNGVAELNKILISQINSMLSEFDAVNIEKLYASGNATMLHLFFSVDCSSMGVSPYMPLFLEGKTEKAENLGLMGVKTVESLPSIAAFVGADIVAGLNCVGMPEKGKHSLLIDLGTNAEIVLFSNESALCTAAAAGPCFEGANISCGMSATDGAIYSYSNGAVKTVGDVPARGVCGTGLVDIVAQFICDGTIDETGYMECETASIAQAVNITQDDIRQYQLAKSAVYSAVLTLMKMKNVSFDDIDKMYISGGFSAKINIGNAVKTGLLPKELSRKCIAINNSSLLGTFKYACEKNELSVYVDNSTYVDLSANTTFADLFIGNMMFDA